ncbi:MAG TPA: PhoH family protein [Bacillota bacterium]|nr:PhoH family protein [Bacillota bacterium]
MSDQNHETTIQILDPDEALALFGTNDRLLKRIEDQLHVSITTRGEQLLIRGKEKDVKHCEDVLHAIMDVIRRGIEIHERDIIYAIELAKKDQLSQLEALFADELTKNAKGKSIRIKTLGQKKYVEKMNESDLVFGIGPAGTGKTFLAVVQSIIALRSGVVKKIILTRPAVEAGESLGFLPGDLKEKVDPYLRPLYDALHDVFGVEHTARLIEREVIEIAPLAYMRGRTLNDAFVILDEAQNTTQEQMKMFLTRLGFGSKMVVTGDITQIDLPKGAKSGLQSASKLLTGVKGISFAYLEGSDVVRHPVVQRIIEAYDQVD